MAVHALSTGCGDEPARFTCLVVAFARTLGGAQGAINARGCGTKPMEKPLIFDGKSPSIHGDGGLQGSAVAKDQNHGAGKTNKSNG